jgi:BirA family transcriptional regulator, biotin operon repressor / biotin---[acetyl-CoA-carboxylase] ligase
VTDGGATFGALNGEDAGWRVVEVAETGSTNADLAALAEQGERPGLVLVAGHQTAGRGRLGRSWSAPPGASLLVSALLGLPAEAPVHGATWAVGLAAQDACEAVAGVRPELKWPNDLMVAERKLAGILAEAVVRQGQVVGVVVGMGLNVTWPDPDELPGDLADRVVALNHLTGAPVDRAALLRGYLRELGVYVHLWEHAPAALWLAYRHGLGTLGREVRVELAGETFSGRAVDLDHDGALVVEVAGGARRTVRAGDVVHLRPG